MVIWCLGEGDYLPFFFWWKEVILLSCYFSFDCLELPWQFFYIDLKWFFCKQYFSLDLHYISGMCTINHTYLQNFHPPCQHTAATEQKRDKYGLFVSLLREMHLSLSLIWKGTTNFWSTFSATVHVSFMLLTSVKHMFSGKRVLNKYKSWSHFFLVAKNWVA